MKLNKLVVAMHPNSNLIKAAVTFLIAVSFAVICTSTTAKAAGDKVKYGQIEISTNPGGFPLRIDGQPQGDTSSQVRVIELQPGHHTVQIDMPNGERWVRDFDIAEGRRVCVNLNYHPKQFTVNK